MKDYDPEAVRLANQARANGERVLWGGRGRRRFQPGWLLWQSGGMAAFVTAVVAYQFISDPPIFYHGWQYLVPVFWIGPFVAVFVAAFIIEWRRRGAVYAITDQRVLILEANGAVRESVLLTAGRFSRDGRDILLADPQAAMDAGKRDLDGGAERFSNLPRLRGLADPDAVLAIIHRAGGRR